MTRGVLLKKSGFACDKCLTAAILQVCVVYIGKKFLREVVSILRMSFFYLRMFSAVFNTLSAAAEITAFGSFPSCNDLNAVCNAGTMEASIPARAQNRDISPLHSSISSSSSFIFSPSELDTFPELNLSTTFLASFLDLTGATAGLIPPARSVCRFFRKRSNRSSRVGASGLTGTGSTNSDGNGMLARFVLFSPDMATYFVTCTSRNGMIAGIQRKDIYCRISGLYVITKLHNGG